MTAPRRFFTSRAPARAEPGSGLFPLAGGSAAGRRVAVLLLLALLLSFPAAAQTPLEPVVRLVEDGRLEVAEQELRDLLEQGDTPVARDLLGVVLSRRGRFDEAERELLRALELTPDFPEARQHLARVYLLTKRDDDALRELRAAAELGPLERDLAMKLAVAEMSAGNTASGEKQLRALGERHGSVRALLLLARSRAQRDDTMGALKALRQALDLAPSSEETLREYARTAVEARLFVNAIVALEPLERMHPDVAEYAYLTGVARMQVNDMDGALASLERARALEPRRAVILIATGIVLNTQMRYAEAKEALDLGLGLEPDSVEALAAMAESEVGLSEYEEAEKHVLRCLAREPDYALGNLSLGLLRMKQQRYAEARDALELAAAADPGSPKTHYQLSLAYARLGDPESSRTHLELYREALDSHEKKLEELGIDRGGM